MPIVNDIHSRLNETRVDAVVTPRDPDELRAAIRDAAALDLGGSFFLTYSRAADRDQVERAYPEFPEFLRLKRAYDPELRFQSDWWRHYAGMFE